ncbi:hypothetical protein ACGFLT_29005 [Micromonospora chalcea]
MWTAPRLVRPFLGVDVLDGCIALSTYAVDCNSPSPSDALRTGVVCLAAPWPALLAVYAGSICARLVTGL